MNECLEKNIKEYNNWDDTKTMNKIKDFLMQEGLIIDDVFMVYFIGLFRRGDLVLDFIDVFIKKTKVEFWNIKTFQDIKQMFDNVSFSVSNSLMRIIAVKVLMHYNHISIKVLRFLYNSTFSCGNTKRYIQQKIQYSNLAGMIIEEINNEV